MGNRRSAAALGRLHGPARRTARIARRRLRWLVRPPLVRGRLPRMLPGVLRLDETEEEAAVEALREVMRSKRLFRYHGVSRNPLESSRVRQLERSLAALIGVEHALAVNSGTSALVCGLVGLGIGPGDEVVVPAYTWFSTVSAVLAAGAVPIVSEVDESLTIDPDDVERKLSPHTRAVIAVHMRGAPARMDTLTALAREKSVHLIEDVAQAAGGSFRGRRLGGIGDVGAFSFQMSKLMTAGEGGMVTTNDPAVRRRAAMYHDSAALPHEGVPPEEWLPGLNLRMTELQAAVLLVQLERLDELIGDMRARKAALKSLLSGPLEKAGLAFRTIHDPAGDTALALVFFAADPGRAKAIVEALTDENVPASRLYHELERLPHDFVDLHAYPAWSPLLRKGTWSARGGPWLLHPREVDYPEDACPKTMDLLRRAVHVDVSPELTDEQVQQTAAAIAGAVARQA